MEGNRLTAFPWPVCKYKPVYSLQMPARAFRQTRGTDIPKPDFRQTGPHPFKPAERINIQQLCIFTLLNAYYTILSDILLRRAALLAHWVIHKVPTPAARERDLSRFWWWEKLEHVVTKEDRPDSFSGWIKEKLWQDEIWFSFIWNVAGLENSVQFVPCVEQCDESSHLNSWERRDVKSMEGARWVHAWVRGSFGNKTTEKARASPSPEITSSSSAVSTSLDFLIRHLDHACPWSKNLQMVPRVWASGLHVACVRRVQLGYRK